MLSMGLNLTKNAIAQCVNFSSGSRRRLVLMMGSTSSKMKGSRIVWGQ